MVASISQKTKEQQLPLIVHQVDVLEIKYDKAYDIRELDDDSDDILSQNFYCVVRVEGIEGTWATQYFLPEPED